MTLTRTHNLLLNVLHFLFFQVWVAMFPQMNLREVLVNLERLSKHGFLASKDNQLTQEVLQKLKTEDASLNTAEIYILHK